MMRQFGKPLPAGLIYPDALFRIKDQNRSLYLTFDDGPDPVATPMILDILNSNNITATFFCTGSNVIRSPGLFGRIAAEGHAIGNHGFSHLNGIMTPVRTYCADVLRGRDE
jgi:peptidoglycan/xylan/chitin deacetylase (PgdA/CDA1 family)